MEKIDSDGSDPLDSVILEFAKNAATPYGKFKNSNGYPVCDGNFDPRAEPKRETTA